MIKDGATPVTSYMDVIEAFPNYEITTDDAVDMAKSVRNSTEMNTEPVKHKTDLELSDTVKKVYYCIENEPVHIDQIVQKTGMPVSKVLQSLTELELLSLISCRQGRLYKLV